MPCLRGPAQLIHHQILSSPANAMDTPSASSIDMLPVRTKCQKSAKPTMIKPKFCMSDLAKSLAVPMPCPSRTCACFCRLQYQAGCSELQRQNILHLLNVNFQLLLKIDIHLVGCRNHAYALESKDARGDHLSLLQRERATATEAVCTVREGGRGNRELVSK